MPFRMECLNCVPFLSKIFPKTLPRRPETAQDDPRDAPREPKTSPRHPQDTPKTPARDVPGAPRRRPWAALAESGNARKPDRVLEPPRTAKIPPKGSQNAAKTTPENSKNYQRRISKWFKKVHQSISQNAHQKPQLDPDQVIYITASWSNASR